VNSSARIATATVLVLISSCRRAESPRPSPADSARVVAENLEYRAARSEFFRNSPDSPLADDTSVAFTGPHWFDVDPGFRGASVLHRYSNPEVIDIAGTGGELRRQLRYGYFEFALPDSSGRPVTIRLNVYKEAPDAPPAGSGMNYLSTWFTDETTGRETYGVGRYLDIGLENPDPSHVYVLDLNRAYNPFCAYSPRYTCAIPSEEDHIRLRITAGEMKYHP